MQHLLLLPLLLLVLCLVVPSADKLSQMRNGCA
jgi:hypothetical protein